MGITIPPNSTILITLGSVTTQQLIVGRYDPVGITIPPNNTILITLGRGRENFLFFLYIGKKKKRKSKNPSPSHMA